MRILAASLLLFFGLSQAAARSVRWPSHSLVDSWLNDDYELFHLPEHSENEGFYNFMMSDDRSEESKELERPAEIDHLDGFFDNLRESFLESDEQNTHVKSKESSANESSEKNGRNSEEADDGDYGLDDKKQLWNILDVLFGADYQDKNVNEAKTNSLENENKSSEESKALNDKPENSNEDSDELPSVFEVDISDATKSSEEKPELDEAETTSLERADTAEEDSNEATEITDMIKTSEEHKSNEVDDLSDIDVNELVSFFIALDIATDMVAVMETTAKDDTARDKEVDDILKIFGLALDVILKEESNSKQTNSLEETADNIRKTITAKSESSEENDSNETTTTTITTTSTSISDNESNESNENDNSSENDSNLVYVVFRSIDQEGDQQTLDEHKYSVINSKPTTSSPYTSDDNTVSLSSTDAQNSINEYVEIRENLDTQQDSLKKNELDLDKDFYAIISNNLDENTLNKFEKDIYAVQENLYRIKKSINAMENLQTKLYFHKLVTTAVKEAQAKLKN